MLSSILQYFICRLGSVCCMHALKTGVLPVVHHCATSHCVTTALYQPRDERLESRIMWLCFMRILCCLEKHLLYITGNMLCVVYEWYLFLIQSVSYQIRKCVYCETGNRGLCLCISTGSVMSTFKSPKLNLSRFPFKEKSSLLDKRAFNIILSQACFTTYTEAACE